MYATMNRDLSRNTVYTNTARFDGTARALTEDEMFRAAPSIFAKEKHDSRSNRFQPIPTIDIVRGLQREGFQPVGVKQSGTRSADKINHTKHLIRLRQIDNDSKLSVGDTVFEILLRNANDGTASYELLAGLFRIRCSNSLVTHEETVSTIKVRHSGSLEKVNNLVIDGTFEVLKNAETVLTAPQDWGQQIMRPEEKLILAEAAHELRFGDPSGLESPAFKAFKPAQFLQPNRMADRADDLWTTFNTVQEHVIKGNLATNTRINGRRPGMKPITGIDGDVKLNRALWILGERMAQLKAAA